MCGGFPDHCGDAGCHELLRRDASFDRHAIPPAEHGRLAALTYLHSMICYTEGIRATAPVKWLGSPGAVGGFWEAESKEGPAGRFRAAFPACAAASRTIVETLAAMNCFVAMPLSTGMPFLLQSTDGLRH